MEVTGKGWLLLGLIPFSTTVLGLGFFYSTGCFLTAYVEGNLIETLQNITTLLRDRQAFVHWVMPLSMTFQSPTLPKTELCISPILTGGPRCVFFASMMSVQSVNNYSPLSHRSFILSCCIVPKVTSPMQRKQRREKKGFWPNSSGITFVFPGWQPLGNNFKSIIRQLSYTVLLSILEACYSVL